MRGVDLDLCSRCTHGRAVRSEDPERRGRGIGPLCQHGRAAADKGEPHGPRNHEHHGDRPSCRSGVHFRSSCRASRYCSSHVTFPQAFPCLSPCFTPTSSRQIGGLLSGVRVQEPDVTCLFVSGNPAGELSKIWRLFRFVARLAVVQNMRNMQSLRKKLKFSPAGTIRQHSNARPRADRIMK